MPLARQGWATDEKPPLIGGVSLGVSLVLRLDILLEAHGAYARGELAAELRWARPAHHHVGDVGGGEVLLVGFALALQCDVEAAEVAEVDAASVEQVHLHVEDDLVENSLHVSLRSGGAVSHLFANLVEADLLHVVGAGVVLDALVDGVFTGNNLVSNHGV